MTFIIAEAGVNHNGSLSVARQLCEAAKAGGADAVKFQMFESARLWGDERIAHLELGESEILNLKWYCDELDIEFMCTPFGVKEVDFLALIVKRMKVASGCLGRKKLLNAIRDTQLPVIMSTGMSNIDRIYEGLSELGYPHPGMYRQSYTVLQCTSSYPCAPADVNLRGMEVLDFHFGERCQIGYSDHTDGPHACIAAVARGAEVIEKHLTLDRSQPGPDHAASIEPATFAQMVKAIREVELMIGNDSKAPRPCEAATMEAWLGD